MPQIWSLHLPAVHSERASVPLYAHGNAAMDCVRCGSRLREMRFRLTRYLVSGTVLDWQKQREKWSILQSARPYEFAQLTCALDRNEEMMLLAAGVRMPGACGSIAGKPEFSPLGSICPLAQGRERKAGLVEKMPATRLPSQPRSLGLGPIQNGSSCTVKGWLHSLLDSVRQRLHFASGAKSRWRWVLKQILAALRPEA